MAHAAAGQPKMLANAETTIVLRTFVAVVAVKVGVALCAAIRQQFVDTAGVFVAAVGGAGVAVVTILWIAVTNAVGAAEVVGAAVAVVAGTKRRTTIGITTGNRRVRALAAATVHKHALIRRALVAVVALRRILAPAAAPGDRFVITAACSTNVHRALIAVVALRVVGAFATGRIWLVHATAGVANIKRTGVFVVAAGIADARRRAAFGNRLVVTLVGRAQVDGAAVVVVALQIAATVVGAALDRGVGALAGFAICEQALIVGALVAVIALAVGLAAAATSGDRDVLAAAASRIATV